MAKKNAAKPPQQPPAKKAKGDAPECEESPGAPEGKNEPMDRAGVSRMLGFMKYRADPTKNKKGEGMADAKLGLATYLALSPSEKASFLKTYEQKGKSLKWVHEFAETRGASSGSSMSVVANMYNRTAVNVFAFVRGRGSSS
jgi:hypothetical protein